MPEKKNQHYIPKLYLRLFSIDGNNNQIGLFHLTKQLFVDKVAIKNQAKEDYFYGEDGFIEEQLSKIEGQAAPCLKEILVTNQLPKRLTPEWLKVLIFTMTLASRTKDAAEQIKEITSKLGQAIFSHDERFKEIIDKYEIHPNNPSEYALAAVASKLPIAFDLKIKLLINQTPSKFLTSDSPVVKYNQFLEKRKHPGGNTGLATKGLQIFFPISPTHMLVFYDDWVYKIGDKMKDVIVLENQKDIDTLNDLQVLNCLDYLYFNQGVSKRYIEQLCESAVKERSKDYSTLKENYSYIDKEGKEHIGYHTYHNNLKRKLELTFITQTKRAKHHVLSTFSVQLRNENLRKSY